MDVTSRRPSRCVQSCLALCTVLACFFFLFLSSRDSGNHSFVLHDRRDSLWARQQPTTPFSRNESTTTSSTMNATAGLIISNPTPPPTPSPSLTTSSSSSSVSSTQSASPQISTSLPPSTTSPFTSSTSSTLTPTTATLTPYTALSTLLDTPATTLLISNNLFPTLSQTSSAPSPSQTSTSIDTSSSAGFWQKKGAVAATFVIVSLVLAVVGAVAIMSYLKRRRNRYQERLHDEFFEKYTPPDDRSHSPPSRLSFSDSPMDAFASRDIGNNVSPPSQLYFIAETQSGLHSNSSTSVHHPDYYNTQSTPGRYPAPSQTLLSKGGAPPSSFPQHTNRNSYQPSIDSFYGAGSSGRAV